MNYKKSIAFQKTQNVKQFNVHWNSKEKSTWMLNVIIIINPNGIVKGHACY